MKVKITRSIIAMAVLGLGMAAIGLFAQSPIHGTFQYGVPNQVFCAIDDGASYFTGQTQSAGGHLFYKYRCPQGHEFWVRVD